MSDAEKARRLQGEVYDWEYRYGLLSKTEELRRKNRVRSWESLTAKHERLRAAARAVTLAAPEMLARFEHVLKLYQTTHTIRDAKEIPEVAALVDALRELNRELGDA